MNFLKKQNNNENEKTGKFILSASVLAIICLVIVGTRECNGSNGEPRLVESTTCATTTETSTITSIMSTSTYIFTVDTTITTCDATMESITTFETTDISEEPEIVIVPETEPIIETDAPVYSEPITEPSVEVETDISEDTSETEPYELTYYATFQGTYYSAYPGCSGGSGRTLRDISYYWEDGVKGSIACVNLYWDLGYYANGVRTKVYISSASCPSLDGWYYLDDCTASWNTGVVDFYVDYNSNSPFYSTGRLYDITIYI